MDAGSVHYSFALIRSLIRIRYIKRTLFEELRRHIKKNQFVTL